MPYFETQDQANDYIKSLKANGFVVGLLHDGPQLVITPTDAPRAYHFAVAVVWGARKVEFPAPAWFAMQDYVPNVVALEAEFAKLTPAEYAAIYAYAASAFETPNYDGYGEYTDWAKAQGFPESFSEAGNALCDYADCLGATFCGD